MNLLEQIGQTFVAYQRSKLRKNFFTECKNSNILPKGILLDFNLALGVNDHNLVDRIQMILDQASSNILETLQAYTEEEIEAFDDKLECLKKDAAEEMGQREFAREYVRLKRDKWIDIDHLKQNLKQKLKTLKQERTFGPKNFI